jgi:hypothetical protein
LIALRFRASYIPMRLAGFRRGRAVAASDRRTGADHRQPRAVRAQASCSSGE